MKVEHDFIPERFNEFDVVDFVLYGFYVQYLGLGLIQRALMLASLSAMVIGWLGVPKEILEIGE